MGRITVHDGGQFASFDDGGLTLRQRQCRVLGHDWRQFKSDRWCRRCYRTEPYAEAADPRSDEAEDQRFIQEAAGHGVEATPMEHEGVEGWRHHRKSDEVGGEG